ncbi:MAG: hypothetical protein QXX12_03395 [Nanopusillaceae archaeon]
MQDKLSTKIPVKKLVFDIYKGSFLRTYYVRVDKYFNILKKSLTTKKHTPKINVNKNPILQKYNLFKHNKEIFINSIENKLNIPKNAKTILKQISDKQTLEKVSYQNLVNRIMHEIIVYYLTNDKTFINNIKKSIEKLSSINRVNGLYFKRVSTIKKPEKSETLNINSKLKRLKTLTLLNIDVNTDKIQSFNDIEIYTYTKNIANKYKSEKFKLIRKYDKYNNIINGYIQGSFTSEKSYITSGIYLSNILNYINLNNEQVEVIIKKLSGSSIEKSDVMLFSNTSYNLDFIAKLSINTFNFLLKLQNPLISSDLINLNNDILLNDINLQAFFYNLFLLLLIDDDLFQNLCNTYINNNLVYHDALQDVLTLEKSIKDSDKAFNILHKHIKDFLSINNECFFKNLFDIVEKEFIIRYDEFHDIVKNLINKNENLMKNYIILLYAIIKLKIDDFFDVLLLSLNDVIMEVEGSLKNDIKNLLEKLLLLLSKIISIFSILLAYKFNMIINEEDVSINKYNPKDRVNFKVVYLHIYNIVNLILGKLINYVNLNKENKKIFYGILLKHTELFWNNVVILPHVLFFMDLLTYKTKRILPVRYDKIGKLIGSPVVSYFFNNAFYKKLLNDINIENLFNTEKETNNYIDIYVPVASYDTKDINVSVKRISGVEFAYTDISQLSERIKNKYDFAKLKIDKSKVLISDTTGRIIVEM